MSGTNCTAHSDENSCNMENACAWVNNNSGTCTCDKGYDAGTGGTAATCTPCDTDKYKDKIGTDTTCGPCSDPTTMTPDNTKTFC